jgi:hypothetical protein
MGWCWGGSQRRHVQCRVHPTSSSLEMARNYEHTGSSLGIEREATKRCWTESAGLGDRRHASNEQGRAGAVIWVMIDHSGGLASFFLEFRASGLRTIFLRSFAHSPKLLSRWVGWLLCYGCRGVVATSVAGVHKSRAMHKSPTVDVKAVDSPAKKIRESHGDVMYGLRI